MKIVIISLFWFIIFSFSIFISVVGSLGLLLYQPHVIPLHSIPPRDEVSVRNRGPEKRRNGG